MNQEQESIKKLLRKQVEKTLSAEETRQLHLFKLLYEDDEWLDMIAVVLWEMEQEHPDDSLKGWRPDIAAIIKKGDPGWRRKKRAKRHKIAIAACLAGMLGIAGYFFFTGPAPRGDVIGDCADVSAATEIPLDGFSCTLNLGDSIATVVDSSTHGLIVRVHNLEIRQDRPGVLSLVPVQGLATGKMVNVPFIKVQTDTTQQYAVLLPDGSKVRLNAISSLKYPLSSPIVSSGYAEVSGQAYVEVQQKAGPDVVIGTSNGRFQMKSGQFVVTTATNYSQATLLKGRLTAMDEFGNGKKQLNAPGDLAIVNSYPQQYGGQKDSLWVAPLGQTAGALLWTQTTRTYKDASAREFVGDICRWYGLPIKTLLCIAANRRVSISVCYQAPKEEVFAAIRKIGLKVHYENGMISFCEPNLLKRQRNEGTSLASFLWNIYY